MGRVPLLTALLLAVPWLVGCGQKGPLFLPAVPAAAASAVAPAAAASVPR